MVIDHHPSAARKMMTKMMVLLASLHKVSRNCNYFYFMFDYGLDKAKPKPDLKSAPSSQSSASSITPTQRVEQGLQDYDYPDEWFQDDIVCFYSSFFALALFWIVRVILSECAHPHTFLQPVSSLGTHVATVVNGRNIPSTLYDKVWFLFQFY